MEKRDTFKYMLRNLNKFRRLEENDPNKLEIWADVQADTLGVYPENIGADIVIPGMLKNHKDFYSNL